MQHEIVQSKQKLENYMYHVKSVIKTDHSENEDIENTDDNLNDVKIALESTQAWLDTNHDLKTLDLDTKLRELSSVCDTFLKNKSHQDKNPDTVNNNNETNDNVHIEDVD